MKKRTEIRFLGYIVHITDFFTQLMLSNHGKLACVPVRYLVLWMLTSQTNARIICVRYGSMKILTGVNAAGDAGDTSPPIFWLGGTSMGISPPILVHTFRTQETSISRPPLKPISFGYKMPPIRFSLAGGQWVH